jgi:hypothetical protein
MRRGDTTTTSAAFCRPSSSDLPSIEKGTMSIFGETRADGEADCTYSLIPTPDVDSFIIVYSVA